MWPVELHICTKYIKKNADNDRLPFYIFLLYQSTGSKANSVDRDEI